MIRENRERETMLDSNLEKLLVLAMRHLVRPGGEDEKDLHFLPGYVEERLCDLSDNALWAMLNDIDVACEGSEDRTDFDWFALRERMLQEQKRRCCDEEPLRTAEMYVDVSGFSDLVGEEGFRSKDIMEEMIAFKTLPKERQDEEFGKGEKPLLKLLNDDELMSLTPTPFVAALSAVVDTFARRNGYDVDDFFTAMWAFPKVEGEGVW